MKIGVIHPYLDVIGGAEQTTLSLLDALKNTNHKVTLYTITKNIKIPAKIDICHVNRNSFPIGWNLQRIFDVKKLFKKTKNEDLLIISAGNLIVGKTTKKMIIYCHSTFESENEFINRKNRGFSKLYYNYLKKQFKDQIECLGKSSVKLIANSNYTKERINELFRKESKVIFPPVKIKKSNVKNSKRSGIITIARYSPEKNLEFNLKVTKNLDMSYKIYGNTKFSSQINYYNHLLEIIKNKKQIELFCNSERDLIEQALNSAKVYFQSSKETFGISVVEGIMAGCIPIVPDNSAYKEIVPFEELRFKENDLNDAEKRIKDAMEGKFDELGPKLFKHIQKFSSEIFQKNMIEFVNINKL